MKSKSFKDPIHGIICIDKTDIVIKELVETKEFQRLRNIYQLGECFNVFPGATHTRFSHSLGVYYLCTLVIKQIGPDLINKKERISLLIAALLHDIGHGPRSHSFEKYFAISHELEGLEIITNPNSQINKVLRKNRVDILEILSILKGEHCRLFFNQIISGQLGIDRLDYLLRDSYFCGVNYGKIEYDFLIQNIKIIDDELVYCIKAKNLIECILFSRYQMFSQIYLNQKAVLYETLVYQSIKRFLVLNNKNFNWKDKFNLYELFSFKNNSKEEIFNKLTTIDESYFNLFLISLNNEDDKILKKLLDCYFLKTKDFKITSQYLNLEKENNEFYFSEIECNISILGDYENKKITIINENNELFDFLDLSPIMKNLSNQVIKKILNFHLNLNNI